MRLKKSRGREEKEKNIGNIYVIQFRNVELATESILQLSYRRANQHSFQLNAKVAKKEDEVERKKENDTLKGY